MRDPLQRRLAVGSAGASVLPMSYSIDFTGKTALVVGGATGIGNAIAQAFCAQGATVHVWATRENAAAYADEPTSDMTGLAYQRMDVADTAALDAYTPPFDRLDILVMAQGLVLYKRAEFEIEGFKKVLDVNLTSLMACSMKFLPMLEKSGGSVTIVSSAAAFHATRGNPAYGASKTGALGLTRSLADAWASKGVRVNGIAPGFVPTRMTAVTTENAARAEGARQRIPLGRFGEPEEIAGVALFLASPLASYVVGETILVDGGLLL